MEETYKNHDTKCLYFKDKSGNYHLLGQPESVEYNKHICEVPTLEITINNLKNVKQYMLASYSQYEEKISLSETKIKVPLPERYIINENATILFWQNKEKTVVKRCADDAFNPRLAFLTAFFQHYVDMSKNKANKYLASLQVEVEKEEKKEEKQEEKSKFKVGNKVKVIEGDALSKKRWVGKIIKINKTNNLILVKYNNGEEWYVKPFQLKLIEEEK